ncbi:MAG: late competence development ComFB family protein [Spirochaetales bacterium]|nr:late competence development ComFB family protein [Spirochaetales bacterium]
MTFHQKYDFSLLVNESERMTIDEVERQLIARPEVCRCQECVLDMVTMALNKIKPLYRVTLLGAIYAPADIPASDIQDAVAQAIQKVWENPSHARLDQVSD